MSRLSASSRNEYFPIRNEVLRSSLGYVSVQAQRQSQPKFVCGSIRVYGAAIPTLLQLCL